MEYQTKRLFMRAYQKEDMLKVYKVINDPNIYATTLQIPYPYPKERLETWFYFMQKNEAYGKGYECGIFLQDEYVGHVGLVNIDASHHCAEITYFIGKAYWGKGYATEAVKAMVKFGFENLHLERIVGRAMCHNQSSIRVLEKSGFLFEGIARHEVCKDGKFIDVYHSGILSGDHFNA